MSVGLLRKRHARVYKSNPQPGDVYISPLLTQAAINYVQNEGNFVAARVFPTLPVQLQTGLVAVYDKGDLLRDDARVRAPGTESAGVGQAVSTVSYSCVPYALHKDIDDQTRANYVSPYDADRDGTTLVTQKLLIRQERQWVSNFFTSGKWGTDLTGVSSGPSAGQFLQWDQSSSTPLNDINTAKKTLIQGGCPNEANTLAVDYLTYIALTQNAAIQARFQYTTAESITEDMLAAYFNVKRFFVMRGVYATSNQGISPTTIGFIAGKGALLCYTPDAPSLMEPSAGYTIAWEGYTGGSNIMVKKFRLEQINSDRIEATIAYDQKMTAADCGVFLTGTIA